MHNHLHWKVPAGLEAISVALGFLFGKLENKV